MPSDSEVDSGSHSGLEDGSQPTLERSPKNKAEVLEWLRPKALMREIAGIKRRGYEITIGDTPDAAYEHPEKIQEIYDRLHEGGQVFRRHARWLALGSVGLARAVEHSPLPLPAKPRHHLKERLRAIRAAVLYNQPDVQAMHWHLQGGKALALGTIVGAHSLKVRPFEDEPEAPDGGEYEYLYMSGALPTDLTEHRFGDTASENIKGRSLEDALQVTAQQFRGKTEEEARRLAEAELAKADEFVHAPVRQGFKEIVQYCTDSLGIRSRAEEVRKEVGRFVEASDKQDFLMMSVGCGTAQPILEVMKDVAEKGKQARLILIDQDPIALAAAEILAEKMGVQDRVEIHCAKLFVKEGVQLKVMDLETVLKGRRPDICEDSGLREYFPNSMYRDLTSQVWQSLADDGIMTTGNMNVNRPQPEFLHGLMGWPVKVRMRRPAQLVKLHREAGVPKAAMRLRVTQDGVYTLCFSSKAQV